MIIPKDFILHLSDLTDFLNKTLSWKTRIMYFIFKTSQTIISISLPRHHNKKPAMAQSTKPRVHRQTATAIMYATPQVDAKQIGMIPIDLIPFMTKWCEQTITIYSYWAIAITMYIFKTSQTMLWSISWWNYKQKYNGTINTLFTIHSNCNIQWRIQDFPEVGVPYPS